MTITYTWTVDSMYCVQSPQPDYVVNVLWTLSGTDGTNTATIGGNTQLAVESDQPNFVPYADLTEAIVLGWIQAALGPDGCANYEANINGQIESMVNPPISPQPQPLPWATA